MLMSWAALLQPGHGIASARRCPGQDCFQGRANSQQCEACPPSAGKLLAVALLDCTMKVFFADSLKFWLSLYGHKLPVLSMDISSDSTLLVSGSADKNLKARRRLPATRAKP